MAEDYPTVENTSWAAIDVYPVSKMVAPEVTTYRKRLGRAVLLFSVLLVGSCEKSACSPCRPGTYPSDLSETCSACVPCPDGGTDASSKAIMIWCTMGTHSTDAANDK
jgi:hypothetical protein